VKVGLVAPDFHPRRDENRVFYAGSLQAAHPWLPFTGLSFARLNFSRFGLVAIFFRYPPWTPKGGVFEDASGRMFIAADLMPSNWCEYNPLCASPLWDPNAVFAEMPWGRFVIRVIDKRTLIAKPTKLYLGFLS
jgi:hypothetical protein